MLINENLTTGAKSDVKEGATVNAPGANRRPGPGKPSVNAPGENRRPAPDEPSVVRGSLASYANPELIEKEEGAWAREVVKKE